MAFHVSFAIEAGDLLDLVKTLQSIAVLVNNASQSSPSECEILRQISLPCVSTPADIFLVFRTLLNCLKCIIY